MSSSQQQQSPLRSAVFIDAGYWSRVMADHFQSPSVDFKSLPEKLSEEMSVLRSHWYDCLPWSPANPSPEQIERHAKKTRFLQYLDSLEGWAVREGKVRPRHIRFRRQNEISGKPATHDGLPLFVKSRGQRSSDDTGYLFDYVQKGVDVLIAMDLITLSATGRITDVVLVTADNDLVQPIEEIKRLNGVRVTLWYYPNAPLDDLKRAADRRREITPAFVRSIKK